jgi:hypothetical protein
MAYRKAKRPTSQGRMDRNEINRMAEERRARQQEVVHKLIEQANARPVQAEWGLEDALCELEEARRFGMASDPPNASAMVAATMGKAKIMGLIIDRQMNGKPEDFVPTREQVIQNMEEAIGSEATKRFLSIYEQMKSGKLIDG